MNLVSIISQTLKFSILTIEVWSLFQTIFVGFLPLTLLMKKFEYAYMNKSKHLKRNTWYNLLNNVSVIIFFLSTPYS